MTSVFVCIKLIANRFRSARAKPHVTIQYEEKSETRQLEMIQSGEANHTLFPGGATSPPLFYDVSEAFWRTGRCGGNILFSISGYSHGNSCNFSSSQFQQTRPLGPRVGTDVWNWLPFVTGSAWSCCAQQLVTAFLFEQLGPVVLAETPSMHFGC